MLKRFISFLIVCSLICSFTMPVMAHERTEHDAEMEYVLFGDREYRKTHPKHKEKIIAVEDAVYLCVDQFNGSGQKYLDNLNEKKILGIPKSIDEFDFKASGKNHRMYTHQGWNLSPDKKVHWDIRQKILRNTVDKELFSDVKSLLSFMPWDSNGRKYKEQCESFCELLYYVHIIGDHIDTKRYDAFYGLDPLTRLNDRDNPGIIPDLISCFDKLFESQKNTYTYNELKQELESLMDKSDKLTRSTGGVNTDEKFAEYHQCAKDLLKVLSIYVPKLLQKEEFFLKSFP